MRAEQLAIDLHANVLQVIQHEGTANVEGVATEKAQVSKGRAAGCLTDL